MVQSHIPAAGLEASMGLFVSLLQHRDLSSPALPYSVIVQEKLKIYPLSSGADGLHLVSVNRWAVLHVLSPKIFKEMKRHGQHTTTPLIEFY